MMANMYIPSKLVVVGVGLFFFLLFFLWLGSCSLELSTEKYHADLKNDQLAYLEEFYPHDFENSARADDKFLEILNFLDEKPHEEKYFVDVGANVGRVVFNIFEQWGNQKPREFRAKFKEQAVEVKPSLLQQLEERTDPVVIAFEPLAQNAAIMKRVMGDIPAGKLLIVNKAVSNVVGTAELFDGGESVLAGSTQAGLARKGNLIDGHCAVTTIDEYVREKALTKIHFVKVDVEGFESHVVEGMHESLKSGVISLFQVEYSHKWLNKWTGEPSGESHTLKALVQSMATLHFDCYLLGRHRLLKLSGEYWDDAFELHERHSYVSVDVVCMHHDLLFRPRLVAIYNAAFDRM